MENIGYKDTKMIITFNNNNIIQFCVQVIIVICWTKGYRFVGVLLLFFFSCSACPDSCINMMFDILYILVLIVVFCVPDSAMGTC